MKFIACLTALPSWVAATAGGFLSRNETYTDHSRFAYGSASNDLGLDYGYGSAEADTIRNKVNADMKAIAATSATQSVHRLRTYFPSYFGISVNDFATLNDHQLLPGFNPKDAPGFVPELEKDLKSIYADSNVLGIVYLNEVVDSNAAATFLADFSKQAGKPVTTAQKTCPDYVAYKELLAQGYDGIMFNVYPSGIFDDPPTFQGDGDDAFSSFCSQLNDISAYYETASGSGEQWLGVSETGFPGTLGVDVVKAYYNNVQSFVAGSKSCEHFSYAELVARHGSNWLGVFAFEALSESTKETDLERSFGIVDAFGA